VQSVLETKSDNSGNMKKPFWPLFLQATPLSLMQISPSDLSSLAIKLEKGNAAFIAATTQTLNQPSTATYPTCHLCALKATSAIPKI